MWLLAIWRKELWDISYSKLTSKFIYKWQGVPTLAWFRWNNKSCFVVMSTCYKLKVQTPILLSKPVDWFEQSTASQVKTEQETAACYKLWYETFRLIFKTRALQTLAHRLDLASQVYLSRSVVVGKAFHSHHGLHFYSDTFLHFLQQIFAWCMLLWRSAAKSADYSTGHLRHCPPVPEWVNFWCNGPGFGGQCFKLCSAIIPSSLLWCLNWKHTHTLESTNGI